MQEGQIQQLQHHVAQLKESLQGGGLISRSITSTNGVAAEGGGVAEAAEPSGNGADGDTP